MTRASSSPARRRTSARPGDRGVPGAGGWSSGLARDRLRAARPAVRAVLGQIEWMSLESAEMTKHALNGFLALSVAYTNELAPDLRTGRRGRLGGRARPQKRARGSAGGPTSRRGRRWPAARCSGTSGSWASSPPSGACQPGRRRRPEPAISSTRTGRTPEPWSCWTAPSGPAAILGLTYKPGTDTLRRRPSVDLARALLDRASRSRPTVRPSASCRRASARSHSRTTSTVRWPARTWRSWRPPGHLPRAYGRSSSCARWRGHG